MRAARNGILFGLAPGGVYHATNCCQLCGALLPHPFTLTGANALRRFTLCCTGRRLTPPRRYLAPCPVEPGLSSPFKRKRRLPGRLRGAFYLTCQRNTNSKNEVNYKDGITSKFILNTAAVRLLSLCSRILLNFNQRAIATSELVLRQHYPKTGALFLAAGHSYFSAVTFYGRFNKGQANAPASVYLLATGITTFQVFKNLFLVTFLTRVTKVMDFNNNMLHLHYWQK